MILPCSYLSNYCRIHIDCFSGAIYAAEIDSNLLPGQLAVVLCFIWFLPLFTALMGSDGPVWYCCKDDHKIQLARQLTHCTLLHWKAVPQQRASLIAKMEHLRKNKTWLIFLYILCSSLHCQMSICLTTWWQMAVLNLYNIFWYKEPCSKETSFIRVWVD